MTRSNIKHLAIIMDGNRRWAKKRGKPSSFGHWEGHKRTLEIAKACKERSIEILTLYAFSTENWKRSKIEVKALFQILKRALTKEIPTFNKYRIKLQVTGRIKELPIDLQERINQALEATKNNTGGILNIALNYGGRTEIVDMVKTIVKKGINEKGINEKIVKENLYTKNLPDPDLLIRVGGEKRLSNFLPWQLAYTELYFTDVLWPDFTVMDLDIALNNFKERKRNFGK